MEMLIVNLQKLLKSVSLWLESVMKRDVHNSST